MTIVSEVVARPGAAGRGGYWRLCLVGALAAASVIAIIFATMHLARVLGREGSLALWLQAAAIYGVFYLLAAGNLAYQCAQFGYLRRGVSAVGPVVPGLAPGRRRKLLVLVPSYKEQPTVVRQTLIAAALAEYPGRRVVLLIDDPPVEPPSDDLLACRALPGELQAVFDAAVARIDATLDAARPGCRAAALAVAYEQVAGWLEGLAAQEAPADIAFCTHTDALFRDRILLQPARAHRARAALLRRRAPPARALEREAKRLRALLRVDFSAFERKRYANLSHAPNKAMNLNAYIGLIGGDFSEQDGCLVRAVRGEATLSVPAADYCVTVDADSLIVSDYALRLVGLMEQPGNERVAIAQTPYTAVPGAATPLERAAAAATDAQFFTHQGMAWFDASFWVGAAALVRMRALTDIATVREERGHRVPVFIDDRIQIEDAAATVDLLAKGWRVLHAPERLTYSATPADFGALLIQRRRWANGGLLILPRLVRHMLADGFSSRRISDALLRCHNLLSAALAGFGLPLLLVVPFDDRLAPQWLPAVVLPYYLLLGWDLRRAGHRWRDLPAVHALTVLLLSANFAGTLASLRQAVTGKPIPFCRTPKIFGRTRVPRLHVAACLAVPVIALAQAADDLFDGRYGHVMFGALIAFGGFYGLYRLIGFADVWTDLTSGLPRLRPRLIRRGRRPMLAGGGENW